jgi:Flp pilus assembly protein TadD
MGRPAEGAGPAEDAVRRYPDSAEAHVLLASIRDFEGNAEGTVRAAREGLRVSPREPRLHVLLARGLLRSNETAEAVRHYRIALTSDPKSVAALSGLAWVWATHEERAFRNGAEAVSLAQRACKLTNNSDPQSLRALAAAYAETEDFPNAERVALLALHALTRSSNDRMTERLKRDISQYRAGRPLREKPGPGPD